LSRGFRGSECHSQEDAVVHDEGMSLTKDLTSQAPAAYAPWPARTGRRRLSESSLVQSLAASAMVQPELWTCASSVFQAAWLLGERGRTGTHASTLSHPALQAETIHFGLKQCCRRSRTHGRTRRRVCDSDPICGNEPSADRRSLLRVTVGGRLLKMYPTCIFSTLRMCSTYGLNGGPENRRRRFESLEKASKMIAMPVHFQCHTLYESGPGPGHNF
jgi:hypothetical protein